MQIYNNNILITLETFIKLTKSNIELNILHGVSTYLHVNKCFPLSFEEKQQRPKMYVISLIFPS